MAFIESKRLASSAQDDSRNANAKEIGLYQCLIVSSDVNRRRMLAEAAQQGGWETIVCEDCESGINVLDRWLVQLGLVDLQGHPHTRFRELLEKMAPTAGLLLVVCGNEGNLREEVWVRQLGAWLYLPGVEDGGDLSMLCGEARLLTERLSTFKPEPSKGPMF